MPGTRIRATMSTGIRIVIRTGIRMRMAMGSVGICTSMAVTTHNRRER